jgi:hypothetical protein
MSKERLFPINTAAGTIEYMRPVIPRLPELVDMWSNYLEFWAQTGGMDEADSEELERAHWQIQERAIEILSESAPSDLPIAHAWSNMALAAAQDIRREAFVTEAGEPHGQ